MLQVARNIGLQREVGNGLQVLCDSFRNGQEVLCGFSGGMCVGRRHAPPLSFWERMLLLSSRSMAASEESASRNIGLSTARTLSRLCGPGRRSTATTDLTALWVSYHRPSTCGADDLREHRTPPKLARRLSLERGAAPGAEDCHSSRYCFSVAGQKISALPRVARTLRGGVTRAVSDLPEGGPFRQDAEGIEGPKASLVGRGCTSRMLRDGRLEAADTHPG